MHEVIEAMTTLPEDMVKPSPLTGTSTPMGRLKLASISRAKDALASVSGRKSCGRFGPEIAGTISPMSRCRVSV